jgi:hypothetical protein
MMAVNLIFVDSVTGIEWNRYMKTCKVGGSEGKVASTEVGSLQIEESGPIVYSGPNIYGEEQLERPIVVPRQVNGFDLADCINNSTTFHGNLPCREGNSRSNISTARIPRNEQGGRGTFI